MRRERKTKDPCPKREARGGTTSSREREKGNERSDK
jgi:hypothetical protein